MADRDVEKIQNKSEFVKTLRRIADAVEKGESFRIQVQEVRFSVPENAELSIEHEVSGSEEELELQFRWTRSAPNG
jgi:amphi-Trp domain-containing protein